MARRGLLPARMGAAIAPILERGGEGVTPHALCRHHNLDGCEEPASHSGCAAMSWTVGNCLFSVVHSATRSGRANRYSLSDAPVMAPCPSWLASVRGTQRRAFASQQPPRARMAARAQTSKDQSSRGRPYMTCAPRLLLLHRSVCTPQGDQARAGHSSIMVTMDRYGHLFPGQDEALADRLDILRASGETHLVQTGLMGSRKKSQC